jgi:uncharacterized protein YndB with AHSA1/START domain
MTRTINVRAVLPHSIDKVWRAFTDPQLLRLWFMENNIQTEVGRYFTFQMAPQKGWDGITHCEILAVEPQKYISYSYRGEATGEKALACAGIHSTTADKLTKGIFTKLDTIVSITFEPTCGGTSVHLKQSGYKGIKLVLISFVMQMGWNKQLKKKLPKVLEKI